MTNIDITDNMNERHSRTIDMDDIGRDGIKRLAAATVAVVGAGALGGAVSVALTAAGVGHLRIIDFDRVALQPAATDCLYHR